MGRRHVWVSCLALFFSSPLFSSPLFRAGRPAPPEKGDLLVLEAEDFQDKESKDPDFARPSRESGASGNVTLTRLFKGGRLRYRFRLPRAGKWRIWVRYASSRPRSFAWMLDPAPGESPERTPVPATPGLVGERAYRVALLGEKILPAGFHLLVFLGGSFRLDCFFVTTRKGRPGLSWIYREVLSRLTPSQRAALLRPLEPVRPAWLKGADSYRLPAWFDDHRVQAHTRLSLTWLKKDPNRFFSAAKAFREMGCRVFVRHIKSGDEGAWWPSKVGVQAPATKGKDLARILIENAHRAGCRILVYHRHMEDAWAARTHPDWLCRGPLGRPIPGGRGLYMCFNSPYRDYLATRLMELAERGADGFYFDEAQMPRSGCWCARCKALFTKETGLPPPPREDPRNPLWQKYKDFTNQTIERAFLAWRKALHARFPSLVMLVSVNALPSLQDRTMTTRLLRISDSVKTEFQLAARPGNNRIFREHPELAPIPRDIRMSLGWDLCRDGAAGRPAHVWIHGLEDEKVILRAMAAVVGHGSIANLDIREKNLPDLRFKKAFLLGEKLAPFLGGARPRKTILLHYPEAYRDRFATDPLNAWKKALWPFAGAYLALMRERMPVRIFTDSMLAEGIPGETKLLVLPCPAGLTAKQKEAVKSFEKGGGKVLAMDPRWDWASRGKGNEEARRGFLRALRRLYPGPRVRVEGGPSRLHVQFFRPRGKKGLVLALINDFSTVDPGYVGKGKKRRPKRFPLAPPAKGVVLHVKAVHLPEKVVERVSGKVLKPTPEEGGFALRLPPFTDLAVFLL